MPSNSELFACLPAAFSLLNEFVGLKEKRRVGDLLCWNAKLLRAESTGKNEINHAVGIYNTRHQAH
jgi:hypothetical protein